MSRVLLIKNANLYDPDPKGIRDILIVEFYKTSYFTNSFVDSRMVLCYNEDKNRRQKNGEKKCDICRYCTS